MVANILYLFALAAVTPMVVFRMVKHGRYRRGVIQKLWGLSAQTARQLRAGADQCVWFHAVSVGEVNLLPRVVREFEAAHPDCAAVVSTSTDTGYDLAVKRFGADRVFFCPLDFSWAVSRTLRKLNPEKLVLSELELWPNLVRLASRRGCGVHVMNGRLSDRSSRRYQQFSFLTRPIFQQLAWVGAQDQNNANNFLDCGTPAERVEVTGSLKFDDAPETRDTLDVQQLHQWAGIDLWHRVWCVGSTQPGEEAMAIEIYKRLRAEHSELRLILVPRHVERFDAVARLVTGAGLKCHRRSGDDSDCSGSGFGGSLYDSHWNGDTVILVDTIGELRSWWGLANIATVGGSFGDRGGQNMLEPAGYGAAVSFGPDTRNFRWIADALIENEAAVRVADAAELQGFVKRCLTDLPAADSLGRAAKRLVQSKRGASQMTVRAIGDGVAVSQPEIAKAA